MNFLTALKYHESQGPEGAFATPSIEPLNNEGTSCRDLDIRWYVELSVKCQLVPEVVNLAHPWTLYTVK